MSDTPKRAQRRSKGLSYEAKRERVAVLVAQGVTARSAAGEVGVSEDTVHGWLREPDIAAKVVQLREEFFSTAKDRMRGAATIAVDALLDVAGDPEAKGGDRVKAATAILDRIGYVSASKVEHSGELALTRLSDAELLAELERVRAELAKGGA